MGRQRLKARGRPVSQRERSLSLLSPLIELTTPGHALHFGSRRVTPHSTPALLFLITCPSGASKTLPLSSEAFHGSSEDDMAAVLQLVERWNEDTLKVYQPSGLVIIIMVRQILTLDGWRLDRKALTEQQQSCVRACFSHPDLSLS